MSTDTTSQYGDLTVLIVEDLAFMRRITRKNLKDLGFGEIIEAEDGDVAVEILGSQKVDLIISDWNMPNMTGLELLKWVRSNSETQNIHFLMLTGEIVRENVIEALAAKVSQYIVKPFTAATLAEKLKIILK